MGFASPFIYAVIKPPNKNTKIIPIKRYKIMITTLFFKQRSFDYKCMSIVN